MTEAKEIYSKKDIHENELFLIGYSKKSLQVGVIDKWDDRCQAFNLDESEAMLFYNELHKYLFK